MLPKNAGVEDRRIIGVKAILRIQNKSLGKLFENFKTSPCERIEYVVGKI